MTDEQQAPVGAQPVRRRQCPGAVEARRERLVHMQQLALARLPLRRGKLGRLARARLRAEQDLLEDGAEPCERQPGGPRLHLAARRQTPLGVRARSVRLGLGMP